MKVCRLNAALAVLLVLAAGSCVDKDYNLDDIDTTSQFKVNNLVVPINIDQINLSSIIKIKDDGDIQIVDGEYAYTTDGTFSTAAISIPKVVIKAASINPMNVDMDLPSEIKLIPSGTPIPKFSVDIPEATTDYDFSAYNITDDICGLSRVAGDFDVHVSLAVNGMESFASSPIIESIQIQLPQGLELAPEEGEYDTTTGVMTISNSELKSFKLEINGKASALDIPNGAFNEQNHSLSLVGTVGLIGGKLAITPHDNWTMPSNFSITLKIQLGDIEVASIDGVVKHSIDNVKIPDINISNLPDVLSQPGTNIVLANPRLYLDVANPLYTTGVYAQTGFEITAYHGELSQTFAIDNSHFTIAAHPTDLLLLSPYAPAGSEAYTHVPFTQLRDVLSGDGIPDRLEVELTNPNIPRQPIKNFPINYDFGEITGTYRFVAPLQFGQGSQIVYTDVDDGWGNEDIESLTIERLDVTMTVSTTVPVNIELTGKPINSRGEQMSNVNVTPLIIGANAKDQHVTLAFTGVIKDLDGIEFTARASSDADANALSPDMTITLKDLRPCVSGYYEKEL